ncbi:MAG: hypothetical protein QME87_09865 [Bacillota bacterium]|nr:hypothetical protein [Bacillota bacterium]
MGLSVYYWLRLNDGDPAAVLGRLRQAALDLPVEAVSEVLYFRGEACSWRNVGEGDPLWWILLQARKPVSAPRVWLDVEPIELHVFQVALGAGCEPAVFGLARYPEFLEVAGERVPVPDAGAWTWVGRVKTQYASNVSLDHFLRCHTAVCRILVEAERQGILENVHDEGGFWGTWDLEVLVRELGEWNLCLASIAEGLRECGMGQGAAIAEHPEYPVLRLLADRELGRRIAGIVRECRRLRKVD